MDARNDVPVSRRRVSLLWVETRVSIGSETERDLDAMHLKDVNKCWGVSKIVSW